MIGDAGDRHGISGEDQDAETEACAQVVEQVKDLPLAGGVKGGGRFIGNQQFGARSDGHGDHDALLDADRKLMRVLTQATFRAGHSYLAKQLNHGFAGGATGLMQSKWFSEVTGHG